MATRPNPCVRVSVSVSQVPAGMMRLPATRRVGVGCPALCISSRCILDVEGLPEELAGLGVVGLLFEVVQLLAQGGVRDRGLVFLWQVKLALLLEARAGVALTQDLEGRPMLGELLRDTALVRDDGLRGLLGLLVLRAGGRRGGHLPPLECQMKAVELR